MRKARPQSLYHEKAPLMRLLAEQSFSRAAGAPHVPGNSVRLLKDADQNYPAWLEAMEAAEKSIHFENYILADDEIGRSFAAVMADKARQGVRVRLLYDWFGCLGRSSGRFWNHLKNAGVEVRCFNPPSALHPFGWFNRDHRKMITVDGLVGFVSGLCVSRKWAGDKGRSIEPWRDTGIMVKGPAVADIERAFADTWSVLGAPLPKDEVPERGGIQPAGDVTLRVISSLPNTAWVYRLDQLIATLARQTLWLTDAYFVGVAPYVQTLAAAARDGVDVRLLVPGTTDVPVLSAVSRAGYPPLLEAGVRIFEWNGPMLHAKTAVADSRWARIGSTNLNISSWFGNYELDVAIEDEAFADDMERMYLEDLARSTEIVLGRRHRASPVVKRPRPAHHMAPGGKARLGRAGVGAMRVGNVMAAAIGNRRMLEPAEAKIMVSAAGILLTLAALAVLWPRLLTVPFAVLSAWVAVALIVRAYRLRRHAGDEKAAGADVNAEVDRSRPESP